MKTRIRSVKRRLLVSYLLLGLVSPALLVVFWFSSTYLSTCTERALIASRHLQAEAADLHAGLEAVCRGPGPAPSRFAIFAETWEARHAGLIVRLQELEGREWTQLAGESSPREALIDLLPSAVPESAIVLLNGRAYQAAVGRAPGGSPVAVALLPLDASNLSRAGQEVKASLSFGPAGTKEGTRGLGAALVPSVEERDGWWMQNLTVLRADVGFLDAVAGMRRDVRENPVALLAIFVLNLVGVIFISIETATVRAVVRMGRSIARATSALQRGASELEGRNLGYRIPIQGDDDLWDVAAAFNRMAAGLEEGRAAEIERERLESELRLAREIHSRLLPAGAPQIAGLDLAGTSIPADRVGGDFFDYILEDRMTERGRGVGLVIADVAGKGLAAALLMSSFRASLLSQAQHEANPAAILGEVNQFLLRVMEPGRFVTAFLGFLDPASGTLVYASAGHNPPLLVRATGESEELAESGMILGIMDGVQYPAGRVELRPGDLLALYTDGVTEAQSAIGELWGEGRFLDLLRRSAGASCAEIVARLLEELRAFEGTHGRSDDITALFVRRLQRG